MVEHCLNRRCRQCRWLAVYQEYTHCLHGTSAREARLLTYHVVATGVDGEESAVTGELFYARMVINGYIATLSYRVVARKCLRHVNNQYRRHTSR